jgi:hypothetical protein
MTIDASCGTVWARVAVTETLVEAFRRSFAGLTAISIFTFRTASGFVLGS